MEQLNMEWVNEVEVPKEITTVELDLAVENMVLAKENYQNLKDAASEANKEYERRQKIVLDMLIKCNKSSYKVDGVGTVSAVDRFYVQTPKEIKDKKDFFNWLQYKYGDDGLHSYLTVNYATLNSLWKNEFENSSCQATFKIPGIGSPVTEKEIRFTTTKK